jgi:hypothetical protein
MSEQKTKLINKDPSFKELIFFDAFFDQGGWALVILKKKKKKKKKKLGNMHRSLKFLLEFLNSIRR